jgi:cytosine/adenosine deaminase-related metal-dependent hydrolase
MAGDLFTQMRTAYAIERALAAQRQDGRPLLTARDILQMATIDGARAVWLEHKVGSLRVGKQADIILLRTDRLHLTPVNDLVGAVTLSANAGDVDTVFVAGRLLKHHGALVGVEMARVRRLVDESRAYLLARLVHLTDEEKCRSSAQRCQGCCPGRPRREFDYTIGYICHCTLKQMRPVEMTRRICLGWWRG